MHSTWMKLHPAMLCVQHTGPVVDDEADMLDLLRIGLAQCGAEVTTAGSAQEALEAIEKEKPDLLVSDIEMAGE